MQKLYNICVNCWRKEQYCNCNKRRLESIDHNMIYIITNLNKKGFNTKFCCGGHVEKQFVYIYINFIENYNFNILPDGFNYKKKILSYKKTKLKTNTEIQKEINYRIKILKEWVKLL